jgi:hypothetical protein
MENIDIRNPEKSDSKCAASLMIASELAMSPPASSVHIKSIHTIETQTNVFNAEDESSHFLIMG